MTTEMKQELDWRKARGAGVRIALIDSGVNPQHSHVGGIAGGVGFSVNADRVVQRHADFGDRIGHGTALAGILKAKAPQAELYAVKIFTDRLQVSFPVLDQALQWAITERMHIINLSLGTTNSQHRDRLTVLVAEAREAGTMIVASAPAGQSAVFPAVLPGVIGVADDDRCSWAQYRYVAHAPIPFRAHPSPRPLPGPAQAHNFRGPSFASAHVSALLALLLEMHPGVTGDDARALLIKVIQGMEA
ncbi:MAG: S8 family serine peptidase [Candidatus Binatia bacterium]